MPGTYSAGVVNIRKSFFGSLETAALSQITYFCTNHVQ
jgi:hypothetical protein